MAITGVRLVDGDRQMLLMPRDGVRVQQLDVPFPAVREVSSDRTDDDGERDTTSLHGARACSIKLLVLAGPRAVEDELSRYLHPRTRPYLHVIDDEWAQERRLRLRVVQQEAPIGVDLAPHQRLITAQWKVPDGIWEAAAASGEDVNADISSDVGLSFPVSFPLGFATTLSTGAATLTNLGAVPSHFIARLYGPCAAPKLINETTGEQIAFTSGLTLGPGDYVEISTRERSAYFLSMASQSRLHLVDFAATSWWRIEPGDQLVRYAPASVSPGSVAEITYRPAWL